MKVGRLGRNSAPEEIEEDKWGHNRREYAPNIHMHEIMNTFSIILKKRREHSENIYSVQALYILLSKREKKTNRNKEGNRSQLLKGENVFLIFSTLETLPSNVIKYKTNKKSTKEIKS